MGEATLGFCSGCHWPHTREMSYDPVKQIDEGGYYPEDDVAKKSKVLFFFNILCLFIALANFSLCIWVRFDLDFWEWCLEIQWYTYWKCMYVVMVAMICHAVNSGLSAYAAWIESPSLLLLSMVLRLFVWLVTAVGAVLILLYGLEESSLLTTELNEVFLGLIHRWDTDPRASRVMTQIQEYVGCCGAGGNRDDFINLRKPVPDSCRHPVTGNCYGWGCGQTLAYWLEPWTCCLAGISLAFCAAEPFLVYRTHRLRSAVLNTL